MTKKVYKKISLTDVLDSVLHAAGGKPLTIEKILSLLSGKGFPVLIIFLAIPFCLPIQIPGLSTPFGIVIGLLSLRMIIAHKPWLPKTVLSKELSYHSIEKIVNTTKTMALKMQKYFHPRFVVLVENPWLYKLHGIMICYMALILALPLPIPLSNLLAGYAIVFIAIGLVEDDGLMILLGYLMVLFCTLYFFVFIPYGLESLYDLTRK